jgi:hypothetical protein
VLREDVVRERFDYDAAPGIHVALVRVFQLAPAWRFQDHPRYGGCRSWVKLPELPDGISVMPVLSDAEHEQRMRKLQEIVGEAGYAMASARNGSTSAGTSLP